MKHGQLRVMGYRGRPDTRQEPGPVNGRALRAHSDLGAGGGPAFTDLDRPSNTPTSAATSSADGVPRTTLTSGSSSIDQPYDIPGHSR
jgi:hypothetical protein